MEQMNKVAYPVVSVGANELNEEYENVPDDLKWIVYWYEDCGHEGQGMLLYACADGTFGWHSLSHCSCHGPIDEGDTDWSGEMDEAGLRELLIIDETSKCPRVPADNDYKQWTALADGVRKELDTTLSMADVRLAHFISQSKQSVADMEAQRFHLVAFLKNNGYKFTVTQDCITIDA